MNGILAYILGKKYTDKKVSELPSMFKIKSPVDDFEHLPSSGNVAGDVRETLDTGHEFYWDGTKWNAFHNAIEVDTELSGISENPVRNKVIKHALDIKQNIDEDAEVGEVAIFNNDGSTVTSGAVIVDSSSINEVNDSSIPTTKYVDDKKQNKAIVIGSSNIRQIDGYSVPVLTSIQFMEAYNATIAGTNVLIMDTINEWYYLVNQARHRVYNGTTELRISVNMQNAIFVDYVYNEVTDEVTINGSAQTVTGSDKIAWDNKADKETITKTAQSDVILTNHDTVVFTEQKNMINVEFDISADDDDVDFITGIIVKPYSNFIFRYTEPEDFSVVWQDGAPQFDGGSVYEISFRCLWIENTNGSIIISGKWSKVA